MNFEVILVSAVVGALLAQMIPELYRVLIPRSGAAVEVLTTDTVTSQMYQEALGALSRIERGGGIAGREARAALRWHGDVLRASRQRREEETRAAAEERLRTLEYRLADVEKRGF